MMRELKLYKYDIMNTKDYILVAEIKNGKQRAFDILFNKYYNIIVYKLVSNNKIIQTVAEDYVLEAFIELYEHILSNRYNEEGKIESYIYTIAHRKFLKETRKDKNILTDDDYLFDLIDKIFDNNEEKEKYFKTVNEILKDLNIGKKEKKLKCLEIIWAKFGYPKTSDEDFYLEYRNKFTDVDDVRRKRYKCLQKLKNEFFKMFEQEV